MPEELESTRIYRRMVRDYRERVERESERRRRRERATAAGLASATMAAWAAMREREARRGGGRDARTEGAEP
jgi:hypothetical protein